MKAFAFLISTWLHRRLELIFAIQLQHRQNSSWQGRITWMEQDKTISFRSIWEMIKLIESAVDTVSDQMDEGVEAPRWDD